MASLQIPSPNIILNSLGYSSYLTIDIAATTSVQHSREHINKISLISSWKDTTSLTILKIKSYPSAVTF